MAASGGRRGYAVVQLEAKQILAVHEGEDVAPGIRLAEVHADHVILERNGVRETLAWPEKKRRSPAPRSCGTVAATACRSCCRTVSGYRACSHEPEDPLADAMTVNRTCDFK